MPVEFRPKTLGENITICPRKGAMAKNYSFEPCSFQSNPRKCPYYKEGACAGTYIITSDANIPLAEKISDRLQTTIAVVTDKFKDGGTRTKIPSGAHDKKVIIFQSGYPEPDIRFMETMQMVRAARLSSASEITVFCPTAIHDRDDEKKEAGTPIAAQLVSNALYNAGAYRYDTIERHSGKSRGFFDGPTDDLHANFLLARAKDYVGSEEDIVVVSPDTGGQGRMERAADKVEAVNLAVGSKKRDPEDDYKPKIYSISGDVEEKTAIVVDDVLDTGGSIEGIAKLLYEKKAHRIIVVIAHAVLSENAAKRLENCEYIEKIFVTDTVDARGKLEGCTKFEVVSAEELCSRAICMLQWGTSLTPLF